MPVLLAAVLLPVKRNRDVAPSGLGVSFLLLLSNLRGIKVVQIIPSHILLFPKERSDEISEKNSTYTYSTDNNSQYSSL